MPVTDIIYDNWGNATEVDMLYDELEVTYTLTTSAGVIPIQEPINWGNVTFIHKRDKDMHGFNYEFTGTDFKLKFDCDAGLDEILAEYALNGNDGEVVLTRTMSTGAIDIIEFQGRVNLNSMMRSDYTVECEIERKSLHQLINSRLNTKVALDSDEDLDQNTVPVYPYDTIALLGQTLKESYSSSHTVVKDEEFTETRTSDSVVFGFFDFNEPTVNTIKGYFGNTLGISGDADAIDSGNHNLFLFEADGEYHVEISVDFEVYLKINPRFLAFGKKVTNAQIFLELIIIKENGDPNEVHPLGETAHFNPNAQGFTYPRLTVDEELDIVVADGDGMTIVARIGYGHNASKLKSVNVKIKQYKAVLKMEGFSQQEPTLTEGRLIKSAMDALFLRVTTEEGNIKSTFYSLANEDQPEDGCGSNRLLINGASIRGAPYTKFPLTTTIKDMLTSMNAIDCIGMGYEWDPGEEKEFVRVEPAEYFYQDVEITVIDSIFDYKEEVANDLIFNKVRVGYDKYKEEDEYSYDELHAVHEYQTPIRTESNEYPLMSKYNASGRLIEETRRTQFSEEPQETTTYDDDIFIIHVYNPGGMIPIWGPVTIEPFDDISGTLDPETTVNMTLTPKRMLMAHSKWLMSSLIYKDAGQAIKNTFVKQNKEFSTTLKADYCHRGDEALLPLVANEDVLIGALRPDLDGIYSPEWVWFKTRLSMAEVRYIMNALRGLSPDSNNYGYITYVNDFGDTRKGWVYEISYSRDREEVSFKLLKKKFP